MRLRMYYTYEFAISVRTHVYETTGYRTIQISRMNINHVWIYDILSELQLVSKSWVMFIGAAFGG